MLRPKPTRKINLVLEVDSNFNVWDFHKEFKKLQSKGNFKDVRHMARLDEQEHEVEIVPESNYVLSPQEEEIYGIK